MKKFLFLTVLIAGALSFSCKAQKSPRVSAEGKDVKVSYGQPSKRGRVIFGGLEPWGKVWRAGANEATEITFKKDASFGGKPIKAGTYTLFILLNEKEWTVILNSVTGQFGAFEYEKNKAKDVLQVAVPVKTLSSEIEKLTYRFDSNNSLIIEWDKSQITVPIKM